MKLKTTQKPNPFRKAIHVLSFMKRRRVKWFLLAICVPLFLAGVFVSGMYGAERFYRLGYAKNFPQMVRHLLRSGAALVPHYVQSMSAHPDRLVIDIKHNHYQQLAYQRDLAFRSETRQNDKDIYVPADIRFQDKTCQVKLRLKGDRFDHLDHNKWSFRVHVKGDDALMGMKRFSLQHPKTRNYIHEWIYHQALKQEDVLYLRYQFVTLTVNGKDWGVYALEEHFDKRLLESKQRRAGPILKFNEDLFWAPNCLASVYAGEIDTFGKNNVMEDPQSNRQFLHARNLLEAFRNDQMKTREVFDIEKLARYFAISDLMGAPHAVSGWPNFRFYYNPVTSLLEPIGFDGNTGETMEKEQLLCMAIHGKYSDFFDIQKKIFADIDFYSAYLNTFERISKTAYLDNLFAQLRDDLNDNMKILYKEFPYLYVSFDPYYHNQAVIRQILYPPKGLLAYVRKTDAGELTVELGNIQALPIEVLGISSKGNPICRLQEKTLLPGRMPLKPAPYVISQLAPPDNSQWTDWPIQDLTVDYNILGTDTVMHASLAPQSHFDEHFVDNDFIRQPPNFHDFDFLTIDETSKTIRVEKGLHPLDRNLIIPKGYRVACGPGTSLVLSNAAKILSCSPMTFMGDEDNPIIIRSENEQGQGIVVMQAAEKSQFDYVVFDNLSNPAHNDWSLTAAVTFYESPVDFDHCRFQHCRSEDSLNLIRTEFSVDNTCFDGSYSDALDADFANGKIANSLFVNCGNDAVDVSGSTITLDHVTVDHAGDKGISAGESSFITANHIVIKFAEIAVAGKDLSQLNIDDITITNCKVGFTLFQKKPEFGPASIVVSRLRENLATVPYLLERHSRMSVDDKTIPADRSHVESILYGVEYGKTTQKLSL